MSHQLLITLSDEEYARLVEAASKSGQPVEAVARDAVREHLHTNEPNCANANHALMQRLYQEGKIAHVPTRRRLSDHELAEREALGSEFGEGLSVSDMIIEDRGPY